MREFITAHKKDIVVIAAILLIIAITLTVTLTTRKRGQTVRVTVDGVTVGTYSLNENGTYEFKRTTEDGKQTVTNTLVIEDGVAYLSYANCPDRTCVRTGKIKYVGQSITCLPNRLVVSIEGDDGGGVDLVS